ncbi:hypothetical protein BC832DRAFT_595623 [Gaertneriomyces semiglobifer]|nr:hypothetical protein BC832DRAFT_595623 [Gaertneriomyces semiglobifer]
MPYPTWVPSTASTLGMSYTPTTMSLAPAAEGAAYIPTFVPTEDGLHHHHHQPLPPPPLPLPSRPPVPTNVYIKHLPPTTTDATLAALATPYGEVLSVKAIMDQETGWCRGYGFVLFATRGQAENAMEGLAKRGLGASLAHNPGPRSGGGFGFGGGRRGGVSGGGGAARVGWGTGGRGRGRRERGGQGWWWGGAGVVAETEVLATMTSDLKGWLGIGRC